MVEHYWTVGALYLFCDDPATTDIKGIYLSCGANVGIRLIKGHHCCPEESVLHMLSESNDC